MVQLLDVYFLEIQFRKCNDPRPCIVIHLGNGKVAALALISSATGLARPGYDFEISDQHPDFAATGLDRTSYVVCDKIVDVEMSKLTEYVGRFENRLAVEFKKWLGI